MMTNSEIYDILETAIKHLSRQDLLDLHNRYIVDNNYWDDWIRPWGELDEEFENYKPSELFEIFKNCEKRGDYFQRSTYGIRKRSTYGIRIGDIYDLVDYEELTDYVYQNMDGCGIKELDDIIDEYLGLEDEKEDDDE